jgi:hypothetical protein
VSNAGLVTAISAGTATITATSVADNTITASCTVTVTYTVTFNSNGGGAVASQTVRYGGTASKPNTPANPGNAFLGWYSNVGLTTLYNFGTTVTGNITLYANWRATTAEEKADFGADATIHDIFNVSNIDEWNDARAAISDGGNGKNYTINVTGNFNVPGSTTNTFGNAGIKVSLRGSGTLTLTGNGNLIFSESTQTLILRDLTLRGNSNVSANDSVVYVAGANPVFVMHSGEISGNTAYNGGGVCVGGTFTMNGGTISDNTATSSNGGGGGVFFITGTFTMNGGTISGNKALSDSKGGGVYIQNGAIHIVTGTIYGSNATPASLQNNATEGAALYLGTSGGTNSTATYGPDGTGTNLATTNNTINVLNGVLQ